MRSAAQSTTHFGSNSVVSYDFDWGKILILRGVQP